MSEQLRKTAVAAAAVLMLGWGWAALADDGAHGKGHSHASNVRVPLSATGGIAVSNVGDSCSQSDTVTLTSGRIHLHAVPKRNVVRANAADVSGTGGAGASFEVNGSHEADLGGATIPSDGTLPATVQFRLQSEDDHCASQTLSVKLNLVFSGGELQSSSAACVAGTGGC